MTFSASIARSLIKGATAFSVLGSILFLNHMPTSDAAAAWGWIFVR